MANPKFKINIEGDKSTIFVGDHAKVDIDTTNSRGMTFSLDSVAVGIKLKVLLF